MIKALRKARRGSYWFGRKSGTVNAVLKSLKKGSPLPLIKRIYNITVGRLLVSKLWWR